MCTPVQEFLKATQDLLKLQVKHGTDFFNKAIDKVKDAIRLERQVAVATEAGLVKVSEKALVDHAKHAVGEELKHAPKGAKNFHNKKTTRKDAFNEAKTRADIPLSQQFSRQWQVGDDPLRSGLVNYRYSRDAATHGRYYEFDTPLGKRVVVEYTNDGIAHMHAGKPKPGADVFNYDFKENRYQKIIGVDGDHHIYYEKKLK